MILDTTNRKIQVLFALAAAVTEAPVVTSWADTTATTTTPGSSNTVSNGTTAEDIVAAPAASTQRLVQSLSIHNADNAARNVIVRYNDNGTTRILVAMLLDVSETLYWSPQTGWVVVYPG